MRLSAHTAARIFACFLGIAVPALIFGRAVIAVVGIIAVVLMLIGGNLSSLWTTLRARAQDPLGLLVLATFLAWSANLWASPDPVRSFEAAARTLLFVAAAVTFWARLSTQPQLLELCLRVLVGASFVTVVYAHLALHLLPELFWFLRLHGWVSMPVDLALRSFGALSALLVPALAWSGLRLRGIWLAMSAAACIGFMVLIVQTYTKAPIAGILAAALTFAVALALRKQTRRRALPILGIIAIAFVCVIGWAHTTRGWLAALAPEGDYILPLWLLDYQRHVIWTHTWEYIVQSPWIGYGINTINFAPGADTPIPGLGGYQFIPGHPHNWALEVLSETGAVGFLPFLAAIALSVWRLLTGFLRTGEPAYLAALAVAAGYWTSGLFNFSYWSAWWQMSFFILTAICLAGAGEPHRREVPDANTFETAD